MCMHADHPCTFCFYHGPNNNSTCRSFLNVWTMCLKHFKKQRKENLTPWIGQDYKQASNKKKFLFYERNSKVLENEFNKVDIYYFTCTSESESV